MAAPGGLVEVDQAGEGPAGPRLGRSEEIILRTHRDATGISRASRSPLPSAAPAPACRTGAGPESGRQRSSCPANRSLRVAGACRRRPLAVPPLASGCWSRNRCDSESALAPVPHPGAPPGRPGGDRPGTGDPLGPRPAHAIDVVDFEAARRSPAGTAALAANRWGEVQGRSTTPRSGQLRSWHGSRSPYPGRGHGGNTGATAPAGARR